MTGIKMEQLKFIKARIDDLKHKIRRTKMCTVRSNLSRQLREYEKQLDSLGSEKK